MTPTDIFGEELGIMDYILASGSHNDSHLIVYQILGITPKGYLKIKPGPKNWGRHQLQRPQYEAVKITEAQYKKLLK